MLKHRKEACRVYSRTRVSDTHKSGKTTGVYTTQVLYCCHVSTQVNIAFHGTKLRTLF